MPTPGEASARARLQARRSAIDYSRHYRATVVDATGTVTLHPGEQTVKAIPVYGLTLTAGQNVLVVIGKSGNFILGRL